jgi:hypothetical protein
VGNLKKRVERLEGGRRVRGISVIIVHPGETKEEVLQRHLLAHPERKTEPKLILDLSGPGPELPSAPPPPRPEPTYNAQAPGRGPLRITR